MTTAIAIQDHQDLTQSLPELGLRLLDERVGVRMVSDPQEGRRLVKIDLPPLTGQEQAALQVTVMNLEHRLEPGRKETLVALLARIANHRKNERTPQEWQMLFEDYVEDLGEFSDGQIEQAVKEHRRTSNWFPKIAELRGRCLELRDLDQFRLERARRILRESKPHDRQNPIACLSG